MQQKERPPMPRNSPQVEAVLSRWDAEMEKEKVTLNNLGTKFGDVVRDIGTASQMAKDKLDGKSPLIYTAQGFVTGAIGAGLEYATDDFFKRAWSGVGPIFDKFLYVGATTSKLNKIAKDVSPRLYYFIKEGTQDVALGAIFNFFAFRSQPMLPRVEFGHLFSALTTDAAEALFRPGIQEEVMRGLQDQTTYLNDSQNLRQTKDALSNLQHVYKQPPDFEAKVKLYEQQIAGLEAKQAQWEPTIVPLTGWKLWLRNGLNISNPVTHLGIDMMARGMNTLWKNLHEVRQVRKEKGGLLGKRVDMPKNEVGWKKDYHGWQDKRPQQSDRRQYDDKKTVYYGKSRWGEEKRLEEYELKGS